MGREPQHVQKVTIVTGITLQQGGACACTVTTAVLIKTTHAHTPPCGKVRPINIANSGTEETAGQTSNFPVLVEFL